MSHTRQWLTGAALALLVLPLAAFQGANIDRTIVKEPDYQSKAPKYCLLAFGPEAKTRIWLVLDGDIIYADRNCNGDLTEKGERKRAVAGIALGGTMFEFGALTQLNDQKVHLNVIHYPGRDDPDSLTISVGGKDFQTVLSQGRGFKFADRPQDALLVPCAGQLRMAPRTDRSLIRTDQEQDFASMIGTPLPGGSGFAAVCTEWVPKDVHPVAEFEFPSRRSGGEPIKVAFRLSQRC